MGGRSEEMASFTINSNLHLRHSITRVLDRVQQTLELMLAVPDLTDDDRVNIRSLACKYRKWVRRLKVSSLSGDAGKTRQLIRLALNSGQMKAFAFLLAHRKTPPAELQASTFKRAALREIGKTLDPLKKQCGTIRLKVTAKANGKRRIVQSFPKETLALQALVADILVATGHRNPFDFNERWRGPNAAARRIGNEIENEFRHWLCADVADFYPSIRPAKLPDLNLPWQVRKWVVCANRYLPMKGGTKEEEMMARQGLPQGSPASNVIASDLIGRVFQDLPETGICKQSFTDDIAIGARDPSTLAEVESQLMHLMGEHPAGPFFFKECAQICANPNGGPTHAGYHFRLGYYRLKGRCRIMPSLKSWERLFAKIYWQLEEQKPCNWDEALALCRSKGLRWRKSKAAWPRNPSSDDDFAITLYQLAFDYEPGVPFKHHPTLGYKLRQGLYQTPF